MNFQTVKNLNTSHVNVKFESVNLLTAAKKAFKYISC